MSVEDRDRQPAREWASPTYDGVTTQAQSKNARLVAALSAGAVEPNRIYEIGCGTGALTEWIVRQWPTAIVHASDISPAMIAMASSKKHLAGVQFVEGSFLTTAVDGTYDLVTSNAALHWMHPRYTEVFHTMSSLLRPGGVVCAAMAGRTAGTDAFDTYVADHIAPPVAGRTTFGERRVTPFEVRQLAESAGLDVQDTFLVERHEHLTVREYLTWRCVSGGKEVPTTFPTGSAVADLDALIEVVRASVVMLLSKPVTA